MFCLHRHFWFPILGSFGLFFNQKPILFKDHAYLKPGMLLNSTSITLNCATLVVVVVYSGGFFVPFIPSH